MHSANVFFAARNRDSMASLVGNSVMVSLGFGSLLAAVLAAAFAIAPDLISVHSRLLLLALVWIPLGLAYLLLQSLILGVQDVRGYNLCESALKVVPLILIGFVVLTGRVSVTAVFATTVMALVLNDIWIFNRLRNYYSGWPLFSLSLFRDGIAYAVKAYFAALFAFLVLRADLFMVQHMLGPEQAGYYSIASTMADYVATLATIIGMILFPKLSALTDTRVKLAITKKAAAGTAVA